MDFYVSKGTIVNIAFLDLSKAFDKQTFPEVNATQCTIHVPGVLVKLLHSRYGCCSAVVRWGQNVSCAVQVQCDVRQGGVSALFAV